jgi:hypothetical protein
VPLDPGLDGTASLPEVELTVPSGRAVHTRGLESNVVVHRPKEAVHLLPGWVHRIDVVPGQQPANPVEYRADVGQKGERGRIVRGRRDSPVG